MQKLYQTSVLCASVILFQISLMAQVNEQTIKDHIYYLASEELNGRIAGTDEGRLAADYIFNQFSNAGLTAFSHSTIYYQYFTRSRKYASPSVMVLNSDTIGVAHINKMHHYTASDSFSFVSPARYTTLTNPDSDTFVVFHAEEFDEGMQRIKAFQNEHLPQRNYLLLMPDKKNQKSFKINLKSLKKADDAHEVYVLTNYLHYAHNKQECDNYLDGFSHLNVIVANEKRFKADGIIDGNVDQRFEFFEEPDSIAHKHFQNVIAKIEGSDPSKPAMVFCAHYDHIDSLYSRKTKGVVTTDFYPGADDNASGTAAVIEIARSLKAASYQPEQTLYFCLFDAEELGLYGSRYFAKAIGQDVDLVINMDMIGRNKKDRKRCENIIFGRAQGKTGKAFTKGFDKYCRDNAESLKIRRYDMDFLLFLAGYASDQASFRPNSDTSVFYTGLHKDYHTHNDTPDKINYKKLTEYVNMMSGYLVQYGQ